MDKSNYEIVKNMNKIELSAWIAVQIKQYYLSDNTVISDDETKQIAHTYLDWFSQIVEKEQTE